MTSWMECGCGGDVILYENPGTERYGRTWMILTGTCKQCGMYHETVPMADLKEYKRLMQEDELRQLRQEIEAEKEQERQYRESLTPQQLLEYLGPDEYPWFHVFICDKPMSAGHHTHALTLEDARLIGTAQARKGQWITVERGYEVLDRWQDGTRPELKRFYGRIYHDYKVHDTGEIKHTNGESTHIDADLDRLRDRMRKEMARWMSPDHSATYFRFTIEDEDGKIIEDVSA